MLWPQAPWWPLILVPLCVWAARGGLAILLRSKANSLVPPHPPPPLEGSTTVIPLAGVNLSHSHFYGANVEVLLRCWEAARGVMETGGEGEGFFLMSFYGRV